MNESSEFSKSDKVSRILEMYTKLASGSVINKMEEAQNYGVTERSIQRDIDDIRSYFQDCTAKGGRSNDIIYDRDCKGYRIEKREGNNLSNSQMLAVCKILLESRALKKEDMNDILNKLLANCVSTTDKKMIKELISNERFNYVEPHHGQEIMETMWEIGQAIQMTKYIEIEYVKPKDKSIVKRKLKPAAIMFSEYYFYLAAFIENKEIKDNIDDEFPTIYRIDRIQKYKILPETFHIAYSERFQDGEFRKHIPFMYSGKLRRVRFKYFGYDVDAVLDRLPTAKIDEKASKDGEIVFVAEVYGNGIDMWLRSQGELVEVMG